jgi:hypothetical protein
MLRKAGQDFSKNQISRQSDPELQGFLTDGAAGKHPEDGNTHYAAKTGAN